MFDDKPVAGHVWVVAPPFEIIDVALHGQLWQRGEAALLPKAIVVETARRITAEANDFMATSILEREYRRLGAVTLRYACASLTVSDGDSLHAITSRRWNGRLAGELYDEVIRPALRAVEPN